MKNTKTATNLGKKNVAKVLTFAKEQRNGQKKVTRRFKMGNKIGPILNLFPHIFTKKSVGLEILIHFIWNALCMVKEIVFPQVELLK